MASSAGQTAYSSNPFRRRSVNSSAAELDISNPSSPSPAAPFNNLNSSAEPRGDTSADIYPTSQPAAPRQPFTTFRSALPDGDAQGSGDDSLQFRPKKIVKKVRVQSPPPSSPEEAVPVTKPDSDEYSYDDDSNDDTQSDVSAGIEQRLDPFNGRSLALGNEKASDPVTSPSGPPGNPFSRTLEDIGPGAQSEDASGGGGATKGAMDVDSFKRLLLTGYSDLPAIAKSPGAATASSAGTAAATAHDAASNTDASSISRQSIFDQMQDTPRSSHEASEPETPEKTTSTVAPSRLATSTRSPANRPKPPPPSSRHGKLIKVELGADERSSTPSSDINKPLPSPPSRHLEEDVAGSPFYGDSAGGTPVTPTSEHTHRSPTSPTTRHRSGSQSSTQSRRPAAPPQAPPPRRLARTEGKAPNSQSNIDEDPPRSSLESTRSRAESIRTGNPSLPAPPPPRRPNHGRSTSSFSSANMPGASNAQAVSPGAGGTPQRKGSVTIEGRTSPESARSLTLNDPSRDAAPKVAAPPPPPARHSSGRRPGTAPKSPEIGSTQSDGRKATNSRNSVIAPPPPPPRQRMGSYASTDDQSQPALKEAQPQTGAIPPQDLVMEDHGAEILADLDALQREVDALMNQAKVG